MTEKQILYKAVSNAAWGYFFLCFDVNIGTVSILPSFIGYLLIFSSIQQLAKERRDLALLRPLAIFLAVWSILEWLLSWVGMNPGGEVLFLDLLVIAANLYLHFQFLTDMAALAEAHQPEGAQISRQILSRRSVYIILVTLCVLYAQFNSSGAESAPAFSLAFILLIALAAASFLVMLSLFRLRRVFDEKAIA